MNYGKNMETDFPSMPKIDLEKVFKQIENLDRNKHAKLSEDMVNKMNVKQKEIFDKIKNLWNRCNVIAKRQDENES